MSSVLFICESYYRKASANGICVRNVAEELANQGHHVDVITLFSDTDQPSRERINDVSVYRVDPGFIKRKLYTYEKSGESEKYKKILKLSSINGAIHAFCYPLLSRRQVLNLSEKAEQLYQKTQYEHVVVVYQQIHPVLAGINLKKKHPAVDLVLYTLDAISGGWVPRILRSQRIPQRSLKRWEKYFFAHVDRAFVMESHRAWYAAKEYDRYRDKMEYLDIPLLKPQHGEKKKADSELHAVYTGSMHAATANPQYLLKILPYLQDVTIDLYGNISEDILSKIRKAQANGGKIVVHGRVAHDEIQKIQQNADVLLNFGNANPNMIPCKIFEYISTMNKIISFTHAETDSSLPYMRRYNAALIVEENEAQIQENAARIHAFLHQRINVDQSTVEADFLQNTPDYFVQKLLEEDL